MQVLKFGGSSVKNAENINKVVAIVKDKIKKDKDSSAKKELPKKDSNNNVPAIRPEAVLPGEKKKPEPKDTVKN